MSDGGIVYEDIAEAIRLALAAGYDVEIKVTPTADGKPGSVRMPWALINMVADAREASKRSTE